jgi:chemotaxis response regulator CheB
MGVPRSILVVSNIDFLRKKIVDAIDGHSKLQVTYTANTLQQLLKLLNKEIHVIVIANELADSSMFEAVYHVMNTKPLPILLIPIGKKPDFPEMIYGVIDVFPIEIDNIEDLKHFDVSPLIPIKTMILSKLNLEKFKYQISQIKSKQYFSTTSEFGKRVSEQGIKIKELYSKLDDLSEKEPAKVINQKVVNHTERPGRYRNRLLIIGSSTGGPKMLTYLISQFPANFCPVLVVQHMPSGNYIDSLAERINKFSAINVKKAEHGDSILPGNVYIAPSDCHMKVNFGLGILNVNLVQGPPVNFVVPSVDVTLQSIAKLYGHQSISLILTGMGHDGREGSRSIKQYGGKVFALNKEDSVVYGMNRSVIEAGLVDKILDLDGIVPALKNEIFN